MNLRAQSRAFVIRAATLAQADRLALRMQGRKRQFQGLVVGVHETPLNLAAQFRAQLEWVTRHFTISTFEDFAALWKRSDEFRGSKTPVLFTFDDGRESNYTVAAPMLESFGGRGVFFIVPAFAGCAAGDALSFYQSRINPNSRPGDEEWEDWKPMKPAQIEDLARRGHAIGNHTLTHRRLVGLSAQELETEIGDSARILASWTNKPVDAFAWTFGWNEIDAAAWEHIHRYHRFCFAPCPGVVDSRYDAPSLLWRREIEAKYSAEEYRFLYSGLADPWWSSRRNALRRMLGPSPDQDPHEPSAFVGA